MFKKTKIRLLNTSVLLVFAVFAVFIPAGTAQAAETVYESFTSAVGETSFTSALGSGILAQSFIASSNHNVNAVQLKMYKQTISGTGNVYASIRLTEKKTFNIDGTDYILDVPKGPDLASGYISDSGVTTSTGGAWYQINLNQTVQLTSGKIYAIVLSSTSNPMHWKLSPGYTYGNASSGSSYSGIWSSADHAYDFLFQVLGDPDILGVIPTATNTGVIGISSNAGTIDQSSIQTLSEDDLSEDAQNSMPVGVQFPHGFLKFNITGLAVGASVDVTLTMPDPMPPSTKYWKWDDSWVQVPVSSNDGDNVIIITLVDGGPGDSGGANGIIEDDGGPSVPPFSIDFTAAPPLTGLAPLAVQFTDQSFGDITTWEWDFDNDGTVDSTERHPLHIFNLGATEKSKTFDVKLTINLAGGGTYSLVKDDYITVYKPPIADFSASPTSGDAPLNVNFWREVIGGYQTLWLWDFGDGSTSTVANPGWHMYNNPGIYTVSLTVSLALNGNTLLLGSDTETKVDYITVYGEPVAHFSASPTSGLAPLSVQFTDLSIGSLTSYEWDFDNNGSVDSTSQNPLYTYTSPGTYSVSFTASGAGGSDTETKIDYITVYAPAAAGFSGTPTSGQPPLAVQFSDESTGDVDTYEWDFDNSGIVDSTEQNPSYTYTAYGSYTVKLVVSGDGGTDTLIREDYINVYPSSEASLDINPNTLNKKSKARWITAYIELPAGYDVNDIDIGSVMLNGTVAAELHPTSVGDHDGNGIFDLMVKFSREAVQDILAPGNNVEIEVTGELSGGSSFTCTDTISVK